MFWYSLWHVYFFVFIGQCLWIYLRENVLEINHHTFARLHSYSKSWTLLKKVIQINSTHNEGLSPSCKVLFFGRLAKFLGTALGFFSALLQCSQFIRIFNFFWPEHWRDFITRNLHLMHQFGIVLVLLIYMCIYFNMTGSLRIHKRNENKTKTPMKCTQFITKTLSSPFFFSSTCAARRSLAVRLCDLVDFCHDGSEYCLTGNVCTFVSYSLNYYTAKETCALCL
jgi:hypothetical protein